MTTGKFVYQIIILQYFNVDLISFSSSSSAMSVGGRSRPLADPTLDDIEYKILDVHENLRNRPVFG